MQTCIKISIGFVFLFSSAGCERMFVEEPTNSPVGIFEDLWTSFEENYAPFEERNIDWQALYTVYRPMVYEEMSDDSLYAVITEMLKQLDDGHVTLTAPGKELFISNAIRHNLIDDALFDIPVIQSYLEPGFKDGEDNGYFYGKIAGESIAYIYLAYVSDNFFQLPEFLSDYPDVNGYIIDLRHNDGGDFTYCFTEMARLTNESRFVFRSKTKNGPGQDDYTDWYDWYIHPEGSYVNKPIVVLTDRFTISAGERSVMAFSTLPNVTLMGDTTNGAHGTMIGRELVNGWFYSLVPQKVELYDGQSYEGIGLAPDVYVKNSLIDIENGIDQTLEEAIDALN